MGNIKVQRYYDVRCDECGRFLSTDFFNGMASSSAEARLWARNEGFCATKDNRTLCPYCRDELIKARGNK